MEKDYKISIAMDGYAGCGKSTSAYEVARRLKYGYLDTGAMYRAVTLYFLQHQLDWNDDATVQEALTNIHLHFEADLETGKSSIFLNGKDVSGKIREMEVSKNVSPVSTVPAIRRFLVAQQQEIGREKGVVAEGRDIGTVVFPEAELKVFFEANMNTRVKRRKVQLLKNGYEVSEEDIEKNLTERDHIDTSRADSPLQKAADAYTLDTSNVSFEAQVEQILAWAKEIIAQKTKLVSA